MSDASGTDQALEKIDHLIGDILHGNRDKVDALSAMADDSSIPGNVQKLCEHIAQLAIQSEVREFRLELMVENLLSAQAQLVEANLDPLTGLPNRAIFHEKLENLCEGADQAQSRIALLFIDLDRFKQVNDTLGHDAGDEILQQVTDRMKTELREKDVLARLGGDEFTVILPDVDDEERAIAIASRLKESLATPFQLKAGEANIGSSIGISFYPDEADTPVALIKNADVAMYTAKESGRNQYVLYKESKR